jgi:trans-2,3-dihydro-3-hydroxyanthranilate isomerase
MKGTVFNIVDVFAQDKYTGNQLAVFRDAGGLPDDVMQKLAKEMGFSETTFVLSNAEREGGYDVRIFTPAAEVPFAGHPTLGTAYVIRQEIVGKTVPQVALNLKVGQIPVAFEPQADGGALVWMTPKEAVFGETFDPREIAPLLTVNEDDIDRDFPIQSVSTGLPFVLLPLRSLEAVRRAGVRRDRWLDWVRSRPAKMLFVFCRETVHAVNQLHARAFCDYYDIVEDPATGSANSCFAAYLAKHRYFGADRVDVRVEQGYEIGRPSLIHLKAQDRGTTIHVQVGGKVIMIAQGRLL